MSLNSAPPQDTVESNIQDNTEVVEGEGSQMDQEPKGACTECILTKENLKIMSQSLIDTRSVVKIMSGILVFVLIATFSSVLTILPIKTSNRVKANTWRSSVIQGKYQSRFLL